MEGFRLDFNEILNYVPNRYPLLMIDGITEVIPGKKAVGFKNITMNEWYMPSHFVGMPQMPGSLQLEALTQVLTVAITTLEGNKGQVANFLSANNIEFKKRIHPGDRLIIETEVISYRRGIAVGKGTGYVEGKPVCHADMSIVLPDVMAVYAPKPKII